MDSDLSPYDTSSDEADEDNDSNVSSYDTSSEEDVDSDFVVEQGDDDSDDESAQSEEGGGGIPAVDKKVPTPVHAETDCLSIEISDDEEDEVEDHDLDHFQYTSKLRSMARKMSKISPRVLMQRPFKSDDIDTIGNSRRPKFFDYRLVLQIAVRMNMDAFRKHCYTWLGSRPFDKHFVRPSLDHKNVFSMKIGKFPELDALKRSYGSSNCALYDEDPESSSQYLLLHDKQRSEKSLLRNLDRSRFFFEIVWDASRPIEYQHYENFIECFSIALRVLVSDHKVGLEATFNNMLKFRQSDGCDLLLCYVFGMFSASSCFDGYEHPVKIFSDDIGLFTDRVVQFKSGTRPGPREHFGDVFALNIDNVAVSDDKNDRWRSHRDYESWMSVFEKTRTLQGSRKPFKISLPKEGDAGQSSKPGHVQRLLAERYKHGSDRPVRVTWGKLAPALVHDSLHTLNTSDNPSFVEFSTAGRLLLCVLTVRPMRVEAVLIDVRLIRNLDVATTLKAAKVYYRKNQALGILFVPDEYCFPRSCGLTNLYYGRDAFCPISPESEIWNELQNDYQDEARHRLYRGLRDQMLPGQSCHAQITDIVKRCVAIQTAEGYRGRISVESVFKKLRCSNVRTSKGTILIDRDAWRMLKQKNVFFHGSRFRMRVIRGEKDVIPPHLVTIDSVQERESLVAIDVKELFRAGDSVLTQPCELANPSSTLKVFFRRVPTPGDAAVDRIVAEAAKAKTSDKQHIYSMLMSDRGMKILREVCASFCNDLLHVSIQKTGKKNCNFYMPGETRTRKGLVSTRTFVEHRFDASTSIFATLRHFFDLERDEPDTVFNAVSLKAALVGTSHVPAVCDMIPLMGNRLRVLFPLHLARLYVCGPNAHVGTEGRNARLDVVVEKCQSNSRIFVRIRERGIGYVAGSIYVLGLPFEDGTVACVDDAAHDSDKSPAMIRIAEVAGDGSITRVEIASYGIGLEASVVLNTEDVGTEVYGTEVYVPDQMNFGVLVGDGLVTMQGRLDYHSTRKTLSIRTVSIDRSWRLHVVKVDKKRKDRLSDPLRMVGKNDPALYTAAQRVFACDDLFRIMETYCGFRSITPDLPCLLVQPGRLPYDEAEKQDALENMGSPSDTATARYLIASSLYQMKTTIHKTSTPSV